MSREAGVAHALDDELTAEEQALFSGGGEVSTPDETPPESDAPAPEEKATAPDVETDDEPGDEAIELENRGRFVRHGALHEERTKRKELQGRVKEYETELGQYRQNYARLDERMRLLNEALSTVPAEQGGLGAPGQPQGQQKPVTPEEDPFKFMRYLAERIDQIGDASHAAHQRFQEQDTFSEVRGAFQTDAQAFIRQTPDFMDAYKYLLGSRDRELQLIGYQDPNERRDVINNEEFMIVAQALQSGKSPAELVYSLAADRGYRRAEQPAQAAAAPARAPAPAAAAKPSAVQKVQNVQRAAQVNKSLSQAGGSNTPTITAESLATMSEAEFDRIYNQMSKADRRALFGG